MILLLFAAIVCWLVAALPGFVQIAIGRVDWTALGLLFFGVWVLVDAGGPLLARFRRTP
jgi:hypothetical protein